MNIDSCELSYLPTEFSDLVKLKRLSFAYDKFTSFPDVLCKLHLKWLNMKGNPVIKKEIEEIAENFIELKQYFKHK